MSEMITEIPKLYATPQETHVVTAGVYFVHIVGQYRCTTPAPQTWCPCGYFVVEWPEVPGRLGE
jgi:hypothetical protein